MKVFVTGATGAIGRFVVPRLLNGGHEVSALARSNKKVAALAEMGAKAAQVSLFDADRLAEAFADHDVVLNLATAIPPAGRALRASAWVENDRIRRAGSKAVVDAALSADVGRLVQESITFIYPDNGDRWIDEDLSLAPGAVGSSTAAAQANAQRFTDAGRTGVVLRFGAFYGPGSGQTELLLAAARRHVGMVMGDAEGFLSSIHLDDAAAAAVAAMDAPAGVYNVVDDDPLTKRAFAQAVGAAAGTRPWVVAPGRLALLGGERTALLTRSQRVSNHRFRSSTGWAPQYPSAREGWASIVGAVGSQTKESSDV